MPCLCKRGLRRHAVAWQGLHLVHPPPPSGSAWQLELGCLNLLFIAAVVSLCPFLVAVNSAVVFTAMGGHCASTATVDPLGCELTRTDYALCPECAGLRLSVKGRATAEMDSSRHRAPSFKGVTPPGYRTLHTEALTGDKNHTGSIKISPLEVTTILRPATMTACMFPHWWQLRRDLGSCTGRSLRQS